MSFNYNESTGYILSRLYLKSKAYLHSRFKKYDVTPEQWAVLNRLWREDGISQTVLAERSGKDLPTITRILKILKNKALIRVLKDENDQRTSLIYLTTKGKALKEPMNTVAMDLEQMICDTLHPDALSDFRDALKSMENAID